MYEPHWTVKLVFVVVLFVGVNLPAIAQTQQDHQPSSLWVLDGLGQVYALPTPMPDAATDEFYYFGGEGGHEKIILSLDTEWLFVRFIEDVSEELKVALVEGISGLEDWSLREGDWSDLGVSLRVRDGSQNWDNIRAIIDKMAKISIVTYVSPRFTDHLGERRFLSNNFFVRFNPLDLPRDEIGRLNSDYGVEIADSYPWGSYLLRIPGKSAIESLRLANTYYNLSVVSTATPDLGMFAEPL